MPVSKPSIESETEAIQSGQREEARHQKEIMSPEAVSQVTQLLSQAFDALVLGLENFPQHPNLHILFGDDGRIEVSPVSQDGQPLDQEGPRFVAEPAAEPTRRTIGITPRADSLLRQAATGTLYSSSLATIADVDTIKTRYAEILQRWALHDPPTDLGHRETEIRQEVEQIAASVHTRQVYIPLVNLVFEDLSEFRFGELLIRSTKGLKSEFLDIVDPIVHSSKSSEEVQHATLDRLKNTLTYFDQIPSVAVVSVESLGDAASNWALTYTETALNMLRCYLPFVADPGDRAWFGIVGTISQGKQVLLLIREDKEGFNLSTSNTGYRMSFSLNSRLLEHLKTHLALDQASSLASSDFSQRTPLQQALISGSQFLGAAVIASQDAQSVTLCVSAMDAFLYTGTERQSWRTKEQRLAKILAATAAPDIIQQQYRLVVGLRNHLVHRGPVTFDPELRRVAELLAAQLFVALCRHHQDFPSLEAMLSTPKLER